MSAWVVPATSWREVHPANDILQRLAATGRHLVTWPPAPFERTPTHCYQVGPQYWIWQPEIGGVTFTADRPELVLHALFDTDKSHFEQLVARSWLPAIYPIWKRQVLHASAVTSPVGDVIAFTGPSGASKSTIAYALAQRPAWSMIADDTLAFSCVDRAAATIALHPLRSEARLRQATAEYFGKPEATEVPFVWPSIPLHLKAVYALDPSSDPTADVTFSKIRAAESLPLLLEQAHALSLCDSEHNQRLMRDYLALTSEAPTFRFAFPRSFDTIESTLDQLEAHAATAGVRQEAASACPESAGSTGVVR